MLPRIVGFDVPHLHERVDSSTDEAIVALLDLAPGSRWTELFVRKCEALASQPPWQKSGLKAPRSTLRVNQRLKSARRCGHVHRSRAE